MILSQREFEDIINDQTKKIADDITWKGDTETSEIVKFRALIESEEKYPIFVDGSYNRFLERVSYKIIHKKAGRIYGLDIGKDHRNPDGEMTGELHKHRWTEEYRDKWAYVPDDILSPASRPEKVWKEFCQEAKIIFEGNIESPRPLQLDFGFELGEF